MAGRKAKDVQGLRIKTFTVIKRAPKTHKKAKWECQCDCGKVKVYEATTLLKGYVRCECQGPKGIYYHPLYGTWRRMVKRCTLPSDGNYKDYGAKGVTVCDRWRKFVNFLEDMGPRPEGYTLERVDNTKGYGPDNCKWATVAEQNLNTSRNVYVTHRNETLTLSQWAKRIGVTGPTMARRIKKYPHLPDHIFLPKA